MTGGAVLLVVVMLVLFGAIPIQAGRTGGDGVMVPTAFVEWLSGVQFGV